MSKGIIVTSFFDYTVRGKCFQFQCFQWIIKWVNLINLFTLYKSSIDYIIELLVCYKTEQSKVLHYFKACLNVLT